MSLQFAGLERGENPIRKVRIETRVRHLADR
jgi:hypothetical protein